MNRLASIAMFLSPVVLVAAFGTAGYRYYQGKSADPGAGRADFGPLVRHSAAASGRDETAVRVDLAHLLRSAGEPLGGASTAPDDDALRQSPKAVEAARAAARDGSVPPYHFLTDEAAAPLRAAFGDRPTPERVLKARRTLAKLASAYENLRTQPEWSVQISDDPDPPPLFAFKAIREPAALAAKQPAARPNADPAVPAFSGEDAALVANVAGYFNSDAWKAAYPWAKFPTLYEGGRAKPLPGPAVKESLAALNAVIDADRAFLFPDGNPPKDYAEEVDDVLDRLRVFLAVLAEVE